MLPLTAFFNKQYRDHPDGPFLQQLQELFIARLLDARGGRGLPEHVHYADDCFVVFRNLGFQEDDLFCRAIEDTRMDPVIQGRLWRLWVVCWSLATRWETAGDILDLGTYNGHAFEVAIRYARSLSDDSSADRKVYACDMFEDPPLEARKIHHSPNLHRIVEERLSSICQPVVVKGMLPHTLTPHAIEQVTWAQIDLNSAAADSTTFEYLLPKLVPGAMVIFDDYGFSRYKDTQMEIDRIAKTIKRRVLELPTGQGLLIR